MEGLGEVSAHVTNLHGVTTTAAHVHVVPSAAEAELRRPGSPSEVEVDCPAGQHADGEPHRPSSCEPASDARLGTTTLTTDPKFVVHVLSPQREAESAGFKPCEQTKATWISAAVTLTHAAHVPQLTSCCTVHTTLPCADGAHSRHEIDTTKVRLTRKGARRRAAPPSCSLLHRKQDHHDQSHADSLGR